MKQRQAIGRWGAICASALLLVVGASPSWASDDDFEIDRARLDDGRLEVRGDKPRDATVTVVNAFDPSQVIGSDDDDDDDWRVRVSESRLSPVPCRVRAISSDGQTVERYVSRAPADCAPKDDNQPPANIAPTANANGPYGGTTGVASAGSVSEGGSSGLGGYSIVDAADADAAVAMAKGCPILANGGRVEVHTALEM